MVAPTHEGLILASRNPAVRLFQGLFRRTLLLPNPGETSVAYWRLLILDLILAAGAILGLAAYVPSVLLSIHGHLWAVTAVDTLAYGWVVAAAVAPGWRFVTKARGLVILMYLISLVLLLSVGHPAPGLLWITTLPVIAAVLLGLRAALLSWALAAATLAGCGWAYAFGPLAGGKVAGVPATLPSVWATICANALFLSAIIALPTAILLRGLEHTNRALAREEDRFLQVFRLLPEPIGISRLTDGCFVNVNAAWSRAFGWTAEEALGRSSDDLGFWTSQSDRESLRTELAGTGGIAPRELDLRCKDGATLPVLLSAKSIDLGGEGLLLVMAQDLTVARKAEWERQRLETELQHAQKLESLGSLAGGVAHDMNNILAAILGLGSTLQQKYAGDAPLVKALDIILNAGERGRKLVRSLTDFARKGLDEACPVDLNGMVRAEIDLLQSTTLAKIELACDLEPGLPAVLGEPAALGNVLMNLCVNAIDAMPEGGKLGLGTRTLPSGQVELTVTDTGHGMSGPVLARAMEPFFTTKPAGKGTGLGLAGVYGAMKAHNGSVDLQSQVGQGTTVRLRFPALAKPVHAPPAEPVEAPGSVPLRLLFVDDDPMILETLPAMLEYLGHAVTAASRGQEALDLLQGGLAVDLVVLDHNMPGLSGAETLIQLKQRHPGLPVLLSTGFVEPSVEHLVQRFSGVWLLNKPYALATIQTKMREILGTPAV
jgi:PAS domain S-box-containing protein